MIIHLDFELVGREGSKLKIKNLNSRNLIIVGGNGCGKTRFIEQLHDRLTRELIDLVSRDLEEVNYELFQYHEFKDHDSVYEDDHIDHKELELQKEIRELKREEVIYSDRISVMSKFENSTAILRYYDAYRRANIAFEGSATSVKDLRESGKSDGANNDSSSKFEQFLISYYNYGSHVKARENDPNQVKKIDSWFDKITVDLQFLFEDPYLEFKYSSEAMYFYMIQKGKDPFRFRDLSSGYESILSIYADLIMKVELNEVHADNLSGIVIIDEIDAHLHVSLQKKILSFLTRAFPKIQFIVTTHSPFVVSSVDNAVIYDLSKLQQVENLSMYSYEAVLEGLFGVLPISSLLQKNIETLAKLLKEQPIDVEEVHSLLEKLPEDEDLLDPESLYFVNSAKLAINKAKR
ncbi:AAA family ATPase [Vibrio owensii]|uniref:AAA family ATPase n=1 Tax=Vibrio owensii TaxID=696485 RepID=UPI00391890FA